MSHFTKIFADKKSILFSDHNWKLEEFMKYVIIKMANNECNYCFVISNKRYMYNKVKWYTPYQELINFEFSFNTINMLKNIIMFINELIKHIDEKILIIIDTNFYRLDSENKNIFLDMCKLHNNNITIIIGAKNNMSNSINIFPNEFDNIIYDQISYSGSIDNLYDHIITGEI